MPSVWMEGAVAISIIDSTEEAEGAGRLARLPLCVGSFVVYCFPCLFLLPVLERFLL